MTPKNTIREVMSKLVQKDPALQVFSFSLLLSIMSKWLLVMNLIELKDCACFLQDNKMERTGCLELDTPLELCNLKSSVLSSYLPHFHTINSHSFIFI